MSRFPVEIIGEQSFSFSEFTTMDIIWELTSSCNYNCNYCNAVKRKIYHSGIDRQISFIKEIKSKVRKVRVLLFGGEPTLHPNFRSIALELVEIGCEVEVHTNLSASLETYLLLIGKGVYIRATWHHQADPLVFINKVRQLYKRSPNSIGCYVMYYPVSSSLEHEDCIKVFLSLRELGLKECEMHKIRGDFSQAKLSLEDINTLSSLQSSLEEYVTVSFSTGEILKFHPEIMMTYGFNTFKDWVCSAGMSYLCFGADNNLYPCMTYMEKKILLDTFDAGFSYTYLCTKCTQQYCNCDVHISKKIG